MSSLHRVLFLSLSGLVVGTLASNLACKTEEGGISSDEAAETMAEAACRLYYDCECEHEPPLYSSEADCRLEIAGQLQEGIDRALELELVYDDSCPGAALAALDAVDCDYTVRVFLNPGLIRLLQETNGCKLFHGEQREGDACEDLAGGVGDDCDEESFCNHEDVCETFDFGQPEGEDCEAYQNDCEPGLICIDINGGENRVCEDLPGAGQTCMGSADACDIDLYCDQVTKTCAAMPSEGDDCAPYPGILNTTCDLESICEGDSCVALPGGGETCINHRCENGFVCDGATDTCVEDTPYVCHLYIWD